METEDIELKEYKFSPKQAMVNGVEVTDYTDAELDKIFLVNRKGILEAERPSWIPELDIDDLRQNDFLPACVKDFSDGSYYVKNRTDIYKLPLDILTATIDYYLKKEREQLKRNGNNKRVSLPRSRSSMSTDRFNDIVSLLPLCVCYRNEPEFTRKYKGRNRTQINRVFMEQYNPLLDEINGKKIDLNYSKQDLADSYSKGEETSYGDSGLSDAIQEKYGARIKKQNGTAFTSEELSSLDSAVSKIWDFYGGETGLRNLADSYKLKISYADNCNQHARKAIGLFTPFYNAIGISFFNGKEKETVKNYSNPDITLAHETAHWLDSLKGKETHRFFASDKEGTLENRIAAAYKKELKIQQKQLETKSRWDKSVKYTPLGDYWFRTCECLARAMEQRYALGLGVSMEKEAGYLTDEVYKEKILPLTDELLQENRKHFQLGEFKAEKETMKKSEEINIKTNEKTEEIGINNNLKRKIVEKIAEYIENGGEVRLADENYPEDLNKKIDSIFIDNPHFGEVSYFVTGDEDNAHEQNSDYFTDEFLKGKSLNFSKLGLENFLVKKCGLTEEELGSIATYAEKKLHYRPLLYDYYLKYGETEEEKKIRKSHLIDLNHKSFDLLADYFSTNKGISRETTELLLRRAKTKTDDRGYAYNFNIFEDENGAVSLFAGPSFGSFKMITADEFIKMAGDNLPDTKKWTENLSKDVLKDMHKLFPNMKNISEAYSKAFPEPTLFDFEGEEKKQQDMEKDKHSQIEINLAEKADWKNENGEEICVFVRKIKFDTDLKGIEIGLAKNYDEKNSLYNDSDHSYHGIVVVKDDGTARTEDSLPLFHAIAHPTDDNIKLLSNDERREFDVVMRNINPEYKKAHEERLEQEKRDREANAGKNAASYVMERLKAAGIEVVTDKDEFNRILEREQNLQKMAGNLTPEEQRRYFTFNDEETKRFREQVDEWQADRSNVAKLITVGKIPPVMKILGFPDNPIEIQHSTLAKAMRPVPQGYPNEAQGHALTIDDIYSIPKQLADPVMVFKSRTRNDSYVFFTERKDSQNRTILIPMAVNKHKGRIVINEITSMYGRNNEIDFVKSNLDEDNLIYVDKKRSAEWERSSHVQFVTQRLSNSNADNLNILTKDRLVNFITADAQEQNLQSLNLPENTVELTDVFAEIAANQEAETVSPEEIEEEKKSVQRKIQQLKNELDNPENAEEYAAYPEEKQEILENIEKFERLSVEDIKNQVIWKKENQRRNEENRNQVAKDMEEIRQKANEAQKGEFLSYNETHPAFTLTNKETKRQTTIQPAGKLAENIKNLGKLNNLSEANSVIEKIKSQGFEILSTESRVVIYNNDKFYDFDSYADSGKFNFETKSFDYNFDSRKLNGWDFKNYIDGGLKITKSMKDFEKIPAEKEKTPEEIADQLERMEVSVRNENGWVSANDIVFHDENARKYISEIKKRMTGEAKAAKLTDQVFSDLEADNYHTLNDTLGILGAYGTNYQQKVLEKLEKRPSRFLLPYDVAKEFVTEQKLKKAEKSSSVEISEENTVDFINEQIQKEHDRFYAQIDSHMKTAKIRSKEAKTYYLTHQLDSLPDKGSDEWNKTKQNLQKQGSFIFYDNLDGKWHEIPESRWDEIMEARAAVYKELYKEITGKDYAKPVPAQEENVSDEVKKEGKKFLNELYKEIEQNPIVFPFLIDGEIDTTSKDKNFELAMAKTLAKITKNSENPQQTKENIGKYLSLEIKEKTKIKECLEKTLLQMKDKKIERKQKRSMMIER